MAATALAQAAAEEAANDPNLRKEPPVEELPPWRRGRAGTAIGRAVHATLQTVDLATGEGVEETAQAQSAAEGVPHRAAEVAQLVRAALDAASVRAAVASGRLWREVYVGASVDGVLVEGFIDLLYETPEGLVVVDYKTDALTDGDSIDHALERYRLQGAAYAMALAESLGQPVGRCVFVFLTTGGAEEREVADLVGAMAEVRRRAVAAAP
jgi:ATP-dependent helicase/nuclease subunit A